MKDLIVINHVGKNVNTLLPDVTLVLPLNP